MSIGDLVRRMVDDREPRDQSIGGIGGLTADEEAALNDLLNSPGKTCECGDKGCCDPIIPPRGLP